MAKLKNYIGAIFGTFQIVADLGRKLCTEQSKQPRRFARAVCLNCGSIHEALMNNITRLNTKCFCRKDLTNNDIGHFIIKKDMGMIHRKSNHPKKMHIVIVICKSCHMEYEGQLSSFKNLHRRCECQIDPRNRKHGNKFFTPERKRIYKIHYGMLSRCSDPLIKSYKYYGAKGISVCDEWKDSYEIFYEWSMNNGYQDDLTIDRIDGTKGYSPSNCRWADTKTQGRNKKNVISIEKVKEIKNLLGDGFTHKVIAEMVGTTHHRVSIISKGAAWVDIN